MSDAAGTRPDGSRTGGGWGALWLFAFVLHTVAGVLRFAYVWLDDLARDERGTLAVRLVEEATGAYTAMLLFVGVVVLARRYPPFDRARWRRHLPVHLAGVLVYSAVHTTLMLVSRTAAFAALGMGAYDYGRMSLRYPMELGNDVVGYGMILVIVAAYDTWRALRDRELREARLAAGLAEAELRNLRLQLQPHFLFNALNTISSTMYDDPRAADRMIGQLAELLRLSLRTSHAHEVPLDGELEVLDHYLGLMRARFGDRLRVTVHADAESRRAMVPSLLLQPLVENAVRHGGVAARGAGEIVVRARRDGDLLRIDVEDDGPGAPPDADLLGSGVGLRSTAERLRLLYRDAGTLAAGNLPSGGFAVRVTVPFRASAAPATAARAAAANASLPLVANARADR